MPVFLIRALLLCLLPVLCAHAAPPKGSLVIIGGALRDDNAVVWERIVQLAGGKGARIAIIPAAAANPERAASTAVGRLNRYGAAAFVVPVSPRQMAAAEDPAVAQSVRSAGGAYFLGGDQSRITQSLRRADGSDSLLLDALWALYRRGGVLAGSSAGAAIMSSTMFNDAQPVLATLKLGLTDGRDIAPGLGFIGEDVFIDQHFLVRGRFARMLQAMLAKGYKTGLGVDENSAVVVSPGREVEVIGYKGAMLIDLSQAGVTSRAPLQLSNARLSYLDSGDRYHLASGVFTPSADKAGGKLEPDKPFFHGPLYSQDMLANNAVLDLMERLIDSDQRSALGLALGGAGDVRPDIGFEMRLSRSADSEGYLSSKAEAYSILRIRLDVRPVRVRLPLYEDW